MEQKASTLEEIAQRERLSGAIVTEARSTTILPTESAIVEYVKKSCTLHNKQQAMSISGPLGGSSRKGFSSTVLDFVFLGSRLEAMSKTNSKLRATTSIIRELGVESDH